MCCAVYAQTQQGLIIVIRQARTKQWMVDKMPVTIIVGMGEPDEWTHLVLGQIIYISNNSV